MSESTLQQQCISYLSYIATSNKIFFFSPLNETAMMILKMFKVPKTTCYKIINFLKKMGMIPGTPDIAIVYGGKAYFIELKTKDGVVSDDQETVHGKIFKAGSAVYVVRSLDEFVECIEEILL